MPMEPLLSIGAFARAVGLAPSALRYYDEAGLLSPAEVDGRTGYRYYTPDLERRAFIIRRLRAVAVPVETMRAVLDGSSDKAQASAERTAREPLPVVDPAAEARRSRRGKGHARRDWTTLSS